MSKRLQIAALAVASLLAVQPSLAALSCPMAAAATPACGMSMSQMAMECPMHPQAASSGCLRDCCPNTLPQAVTHFFSSSRHKAAGAPHGIVAPTEPQSPVRAGISVPPGTLASASPPRHILLQVFRI